MSQAQFAVPGTDRAARAERRVDTSPPALRRVATAPLTVGRADDPAEREADRVADEVLARLQDADSAGADGAAPAATGGVGGAPVSRSFAGSGTPEVGFAGGELSTDLSGRIEQARGRGAPLPTGVRRRMEAAFGVDLGAVRVHDGAESAQLNRMVSARAFTAGQDIFFGAGEYRPDTPAGERVLAHELAHTRQQSGIRRIHRLWNFDAPAIDPGQIAEVGTVESGQAVWFLGDKSGDQLVVKLEQFSIGLAELAAGLHEKASGVKSVRHRKLSDSDRSTVIGAVSDKRKAKRSSWERMGARYRTTHDGVELRKRIGADTFDNMSDFDLAFEALNAQLQWFGTQPMMAMTPASGDTAQKMGTQTDTDPFNVNGTQQTTRLRRMLTDPKHLIQLGRLTAVDLFFGNEDRVMKGNVGNWFFDPYTAETTLIDHVDRDTHYSFKTMEEGNDRTIAELLAPLANGALAATAKQAVDMLATGIADKSGDAGIQAWLDANGGTQRKIMEEFLETGLVEGKKNLVKIFSATRFSLFSRDKRKLKKAIKADARKAAQMDAREDRDEYYKILKSRAEWLKKN